MNSKRKWLPEIVLFGGVICIFSLLLQMDRPIRNNRLILPRAAPFTPTGSLHIDGDDCEGCGGILAMRRLSLEIKTATANEFTINWRDILDRYSQYFVYNRRKATLHYYKDNFRYRQLLNIYTHVTDAAIHAVARRRVGDAKDLVRYGCRKSK